MTLLYHPQSFTEIVSMYLYCRDVCIRLPLPFKNNCDVRFQTHSSELITDLWTCVGIFVVVNSNVHFSSFESRCLRLVWVSVALLYFMYQSGSAKLGYLSPENDIAPAKLGWRPRITSL